MKRNDIGEEMLKDEKIGKIMREWYSLRNDLGEKLDEIGTDLFYFCKEQYKLKLRESSMETKG